MCLPPTPYQKEFERKRQTNVWIIQENRPHLHDVVKENHHSYYLSKSTSPLFSVIVVNFLTSQFSFLEKQIIVTICPFVYLPSLESINFSTLLIKLKRYGGVSQYWNLSYKRVLCSNAVYQYYDELGLCCEIFFKLKSSSAR